MTDQYTLLKFNFIMIVILIHSSGSGLVKSLLETEEMFNLKRSEWSRNNMLWSKTVKVNSVKKTANTKHITSHVIVYSEILDQSAK